MYGDIYITTDKVGSSLGIYYYYYYESVGVFLFGLDGGMVVEWYRTSNKPPFLLRWRRGGLDLFFFLFVPVVVVSRWWAV